MAPRRLRFFLSFFVGVALGTGTGLVWPALIYFSALALALLLLGRSRPPERRTFLWPGALITFACALGLGAALWSRPTVNAVLSMAIDEPVTLVGQVVDEPDRRETSTRLTFAPEDGEEKILLVIGRYPEHFYGEKLKVTGKLTRPENFQTTASREFDYANYLATDGIYYLLQRPAVESLGFDQSLLARARRQLFAFKRAFVGQISAALPEPQASLLAGITIGEKRGLPVIWQERFRAAGLSHIVVLSGYNITIVAEAAAKILAFLPPLAGVFAGGASVILFTLATGASTTALRAALMALIALLGRATGRVYLSLDALFLAAFLMVLFKPRILLFDISFQLSFLATLGVIVGPPLLGRYLWWLPERLKLREMTATTLSAQALVLPLILYQMGQLSLVALPANLLILAFVPATMLLGFLAAALGFVSHFLALPFAYFSYFLLAYDLIIVKTAAAIPGASINIPYFPLWLAAAIYLFYFWSHQKLKAR